MGPAHLPCPSIKLMFHEASRFDECMFGQALPTGPVRKRTKLLSNSPAVADTFDKNVCSAAHHHHTRVQGSEAGNAAL
eukprot:4028787-Amphidinium_carterae.1